MNQVQKVKEEINNTKIVTVFDFLEQKKDLIRKTLPNSITPDRLIGLFTLIIKSTPDLLKCSQTSLIGAVIQAVQIGLNPGNIGHIYLIPYNNKKNVGTKEKPDWKTVKEVQLIIGYKGLIELVNRAGKAVILSTEVVYENDSFAYALGLNPTLNHIPTEKERGQIKGVYCVAKNLLANEKVFVYMPFEDIEKVRSASKAGQSEFSPWMKWYEEMAKKTVVRRICKLLPLSIDQQQAISADETIKNTIDVDMTEVKDETEWNPESPVIDKIEPTTQNKTVINKK